MIEIFERSIAELLRDLPEAVPWNESLLLRSGIQLLICCAGFEERARAVLGDTAGVKVGTAIIVQYPTNSQDNASTLGAVRDQFDAGHRVEVEYNRGTFLRIVTRELQQHAPATGARVVVDLSGMASYVIYRVLYAICEVLPTAELGIYFAEADDYSPNREEWETFFRGVDSPEDNLVIAECYEKQHFQSIGVDETYDSDVFPGHNPGPQATEVIAIPSFSLQRMKSMLAYAESQYSVPSGNVRWFLGQPPDRKKNGWRYDALAALYNVRSEGVSVSTRDFRDILQWLDATWDELNTERHIVIAAMGSKMQHLGAFLFLLMHRECGLLLCEPQEFIASSYSSGVGPRWWLDFGQIAKLRRLLSSRGELRFEW